MKNTLILFLAIGSFISSCGNGEPETDTYFYVKNSSTHNVKLSVFDAIYHSIGGFKDSTYVIPINSEISYFYYMKGSNGNYTEPFGVSADSAYITFDDSLRIVYRKNDSLQRNLLHIDSYIEFKRNNEWFEYKYSITEADYHNAVLIK